MKTHYYSKYQKTAEPIAADKDELMDELRRAMMNDGDIQSALWDMQSRGMRMSSGRRLPSLEDMLRRLDQERQKQLSRYRLNSMIDDIKKALDDIAKTERQGIQKKLAQTREKPADAAKSGIPPEMLKKLLDMMEKRANQNLKKLDAMPKDIGGQVKEFSQYDFIDDGAQSKFQELMDKLKKQAMQSFARDLEQRLQNLTPEAIAGMRQFARKLNEMLEQRMCGEKPDFDGFMKEFGEMFGDNPPQDFDELMERMRQQMAQAQSLLDSLAEERRNELTKRFEKLRQTMSRLNQMIEEKMRGGNPDINGLMKQSGLDFGPNPPKNMKELREFLQNEMAKTEFDMSHPLRDSLENLLQQVLDKETQNEFMKLGASMEMLYPTDRMRKKHPFSGDDSISYEQAMKLMEELQQMDRLERQLRDSRYSRTLNNVDQELVKELMGDEAAKELDAIKNTGKLLEEAGYIYMENGKYELTPRGMRKIGEKALQAVFSQLKRDRIGPHNRPKEGPGGEKTGETRPFVWGDDFSLNIEKTIMNALYRQPGVPVRITPDDFEVFREEESTRSATVLMLDLSLSMPVYGNFQAAKQVAIALDALISTQFPRDSLSVIGFSNYARRLKREDIARIHWDDFDPYTNMQCGFALARKILSKEKCANKQVILISDGEPTAHVEHGVIYFQYPPSLRTIQFTLGEVRNCTRAGIIINTFMLKGSGFVGDFVNQMAKINRGRVFFTTADSLGEYLIVDYISNKKQKIS
jgi:uncharacterized protein with von Willebrand factor type A (vWA) domain